MPAPRVSIIITSYNQQAYLKEAIESVIHQTTRPDEIIIADDHSTKDDSVEMIQGYLAQHPGWIRAVFQKENLGIPKNRNRALRLVTGHYVAILDGDDRFLPNNIESQLAALAQRTEAGCSYSNRYSIDADGERTGIRDSKPMPSGDILFQVACGRSGILRSMIGRYDLIKAAGFLDERFPLHDGFVLTARLAKRTRFIYLPEPLMEKREHKGGVSKALSSRQRARYFEDVATEVFEVTSHLPHGQRRRIIKVWSRQILNPRVMAELEAGRKWKALLDIARAFARDPGNSRNVRSLIKAVFNPSTT
jgi:glycosyltransferase involved in cell wall biosynthesis